MSYTLSVDQADALRQVGAWYRGQTSPFLTLGGYAGTGKSTMIAYLRQALREHDDNAKVAFCAYTGKAARVLQEKLREQKIARRRDTVSTIHSLIYTTSEERNQPKWVLKESLDRDLIIVDEASMIDELIWHDLLSFGIPILAVGDHGQLPPVGSNFNLMAEPMIQLNRIWRQAADSPIIEVATLARTTGQLPIKSYGLGVQKLDQSDPDTGIIVQEALEYWRPDQMILCGYNHTRTKLNQAIRGMRDSVASGPEIGDTVVCLRNNRTAKIYNGMTGRLTALQPARDDPLGLWYEAEIELDGEDYQYGGYILREQFGAKETIKEAPADPNGERGDLWDFGYALTVHKAQGSQAESVLVFEERFPRMTDEDWRRWLYTAVTRAMTNLTIIGH